MSQTIPSPGKSRVLLHIAGWLIFFVTPLLLSPPGEIEATLEDPSNLGSLALRNLVLMGLFYFNYLYLTPSVLRTRGMGSFLLALIPLILVVSLVNWQIHHILAEPNPLIDGGPPPGPPDGVFGRGRGPGPGFHRPMMLASSLFASLLITLIIASISTSLVLWQEFTKAKSIEQERSLQRVASELAVLKLQISPHFLFNTLNNIRWLVRSKSERAEEAVLKLSKLLRYILYQTDQNLVPLEHEIENLRDYIDLQQMRLSETGSLVVTIQGDSGKANVAPLLLLPLAENLFKYGDFGGSFVNRIEITVRADRLQVRMMNKVAPPNPESKKEDSGIGLANIRKRLVLHYPDKHEFNSTETNGIFEVNLGILLN